MNKKATPLAVFAIDVPARTVPSHYPEPFASRMTGREKRQLGDFFSLSNFGVNLTRLAPNAISALRHVHSKQDEFIYILSGYPTLHTNEGRIQLSPRMCSGFPAGSDNACNLINESPDEVVFLEIGDRSSGDEVVYPDDDIQAMLEDGQWRFSHKDGTPY